MDELQVAYPNLKASKAKVIDDKIAECVSSLDESLIPDRDRLKRLAALEGNVIVTGESGTGKSMCAKAIHAYSSRRGGPLVVKSCGGITDTLFNEELHGHVKGAFTGALSDRAGLVEQAHNGTLVLDDFDCLSESAQQVLLHVVEHQSVTRLGDVVSNQHPANVRFIVTTNANPEELIDRGMLRRDFFHRLTRWRFHVPTLKDRPDEIEHAIRCYSGNINEQFKDGSAQRQLSREVVRLLCSLNWPGNFRQLQEVVENLLVFANANRSGTIGLSQACKVIFDDVNFPRHRELVRFADINKPNSVGQLLGLLHGNKVLAARLLGCSRTTLYQVIDQHHLVQG